MHVASLRVPGRRASGCAFSLDGEDKMTSTGEHSLRFVVEKWLEFNRLKTVRVTMFGRTLSGGRRYVCVETLHDNEKLALFFFRHDDGCWRVFPPAPTLPAMAWERLAAQRIARRVTFVHGRCARQASRRAQPSLQGGRLQYGHTSARKALNGRVSRTTHRKQRASSVHSLMANVCCSPSASSETVQAFLHPQAWAYAHRSPPRRPPPCRRHNR